MMEMTFEDVYFWYKIHERQIAEEIIVNEYNKKDRLLPDNEQLEEMIDKKIKEWYKTEE